MLHPYLCNPKKKMACNKAFKFCKREHSSAGLEHSDTDRKVSAEKNKIIGSIAQLV